MKKTIGTICSGFGGVDVGALDAGLELAWGVEYDAKIAEVGNFNLGNHIRVADILDCNPNDFDWVNVFHASLPCVRASVANSSAELNEDGLKESALDIAMADKTIEFITTLKPDVVTLENVWAWRNFQSWRGGKKTKGIQQALFDEGYWLHVDHVNCADFGVPQTRKRMIVRAIKGGFVPYLPESEPWIGWYEAIADLIPGLPDSQFAPWQVARLPAELQTMMVGGANTSEEQAASGVGVSLKGEPTLCVNSSNSLGWRSVLIDFANAGRDATKLEQESPLMAIQSWHGRRPSHYPAAFVVEGSAAGEDNKFTMPVRLDNEPIFTMRSVQNNPRAYIVDCQEAGSASDGMRGLTIRDEDQPMFTVTSTQLPRRPGRACLQTGRVVSMTPRCLARFQSFPDSYQLPESKTLAAKGIGNAVPPLLMKKIFRDLVNS